MPTPTERRRTRVKLSVSKLRGDAESATAPEFPLLIVAPAAGAAAAVVGWLLVAGLVMTAWFTAMAIPLGQALTVAGQLWLAGLGAGAVIQDVPITLTPLGLSAVLVLLAKTMVGLALRSTPAAELAGWGAAKALALAAAAYGVVSVVVAVTSGAAGRVVMALLGGLIIGGLGAAWALAPRLRTTAALPTWLAGVPRAIGAGFATMIAVAAATLLIGLLLGSERVGMIEDAIAPDPVGAALLVIVQLLFLPNLLAWTASWVLGAGVSIGVGSHVSPLLTSVGLLPAIPVLGAVPEPGGGSAWAYAWLASGVVAGAVAGLVASTRPGYGGTLVRAVARGAGSGLGAAVLLVLLAALSRGDLGTGRLVGLGPLMLNLIWLAPLPMVFGGAVTAAIHWLVKGKDRPMPPRPTGPDDTTRLLAGLDDEATDAFERETIPLASGRGSQPG